MSAELRIRRAGPEDASTLARWNIAMARETEARALPEDVVTAGVAAALADPTRGLYWVAEDGDGALAGQLMVTREWSDWRNAWFWWIQSVYVRPAWRRRGVFAALYRQVETSARAEGDVCGIRLYVEPDNHGAIAVYERMGMDAAGYRMFEVDWSG